MALRWRATTAEALAAVALALPVAAAPWHPVPGSANLEIDLQSAQLDRARVTVWLRWTGQRLPLALAGPAQPGATWRTSLLARFDCAGRKLQILAASGADRAGRPVFMSSVAGGPMSVAQPDFEWAYDAVCEAARSARL